MKNPARALQVLFRATLASGLLFIVFGSVVLLLLLESGVLTPRILGAANRFLGPAAALRVNAKSVRWRPWSGLTLANAEVRSVLVPLATADSSGPSLRSTRPLFTVESLEVGYAFLGLASSTPRIDRVELVRPTVDLSEILRWNARRPTSAGAPVDSSTGRRGGLVIREFGIDNGTFLGESGWKLSGIQMHGSLNGRQDPWTLDVQSLLMRIRHGLIDESLSGKGKLAFARSALVVNEIDLQSQAGTLHLSGVVTPPEAEGSSISIEGSSIAIDRVAAWFGAKHPMLHGSADLHLLARGRPDSLSLEGHMVRNRTGAPPQEIQLKAQRQDNVIAFESLRFSANGSRADLHGQIVLGELPAFNAFAELHQFDPRTLWEMQASAKPWSLSGTVRLEGRGLTRAEFIGEGNARWGASSFLGYPFDSADFSFSGNQGSFVFSRVNVAYAGAQVQGRAMISASDQLSASLEGNVSDLASLGALIPALKSGVLQGEGAAHVELEGPLRGPKAEATLRLADASIFGANARALEVWILSPRLAKNAQAEVRLKGEQIGYKAWLAPHATASLILQSGAIELKEMHLLSAERGEISLAGQVKFPGEDQVSAHFDSFHLRSPDGSLSWTNQGRLAIEHNGPSTKISGIDLRGGTGRIAGQIDHLPEGRTRIALEGENVKLEDFTTYFRSSQRLTGDVSFKSDLVLENGRPTGSFDLDLKNGEWQGDKIEEIRARLIASGGRVSLSPVMVRSSLANMDLQGILHGEDIRWAEFFKGPEARQSSLRAMSFENITASIDAPSLDAIHQRFGKFPSPGGSGSVLITVGGTASDPNVEFRGQVTDGRLGWKPLQSLTFSGAFADSTLSVRECRLESQGGSTVVEASVPVAWADLISKPRLLHDRPVFLRVAVENFPVQTLAVIDTLFTWGDGPFWANAQLDGTLDEPRVAGAFRVERGSLTLPLFDRPLSNGIVEGRLHTDGVEITSFTFEDGWGSGDRKGFARGKARIDFNRLKLVNYKVDVRMENFRYRGFTDIDATGDGVLSVTPHAYGDKKVPHLIGKFDLARADLNERLLVPPQQRLEAPPGVNVPLGPEPEEKQEGRLRRAGDPPPVLADIAFSGRKNLWLRTPQMNVEFEGDVTLRATDRYVGITGETRSLRGTYTLYNTRFNIERAEIEFTDPAVIGDSYIDAIATTSVLEEEVEVHVSGTIAKPIIESTSSSGYSEAEIYRLLALRIKRADEAGPAVDESDFSRDLFASWGALVASRFGSNLSHELGIDTFDLDVSESSSQVGLGKYLGSDFFVRYRQQVSDTDDGSSSGVTEERLETPERQLLLEYRLSRILRLQGETGTIEGDGYLNVDLRAEWGY